VSNDRSLGKSPSWSDAPAESSQLVLQSGNHYTGPLVGGRYQVHGETERLWYIVDHRKTDLLVRVAGPLSDVLRFKTKEEAENWCTTALGGNINLPVQTQENEMARKAVVVNDGKFPVVAKRGGPKAALTEENVKKSAKANGAPKGVKDVSKRTGTVASRARELIAKQGKKTDEQLRAALEEEFGKKMPKNVIAHYRADLERRAG
jgi:hypothetical protein